MKLLNLAKLSAATGAALLTVGVAQPSQAAVVFSDNFDTENSGNGALNFNGFTKWTVEGGTVDLIPVGSRFDFYPGNGLYVDLDGSTNKPGVLTTKASFGPGSYILSFLLGGSTLGTTEEVTVSFGTFSEVFSVPSTNPLTLITRAINLGGSDNKLSFANAQGSPSNIGAILDDVTITAVPTPALLPGLIGLGVAALRRKNDETAEENA